MTFNAGDEVDIRGKVTGANRSGDEIQVTTDGGRTTWVMANAATLVRREGIDTASSYDDVPHRDEPRFDIGDVVEANMPKFEVEPTWHPARITAIRSGGYSVEYFGRDGEFYMTYQRVRKSPSK